MGKVTLLLVDIAIFQTEVLHWGICDENVTIGV